MTKKMLTVVVALLAITALFVVGCSDKPGNSFNPSDVVSSIIADDDTTETAWAFDCENEGANADCFLNHDDIKGAKWGWSNGAYAPGTYQFDLYAAAGQCDIDNGYLVGFVTLDYDGTMAEVTYETHCDFLLTEVHLWVGTAMLPMQGPWFTAAPGQFPWGEELMPGESTYTFNVDGFNGEDIYMAAHAVVEGDFENYDCDAASVCDDQPPVDWVIFGVSYAPFNENQANDLYRIDILDTTSTMIHETAYNFTVDPNSTLTAYPNGLAYDPDNQRLYFSTINPSKLYGYDLTTDTEWEAGDVTGIVASGAWWDGHYYYIPQSSDDLYKVAFDANGLITSNTKVADFTNNTKTYGFGDIVAKDGILYGSGRVVNLGQNEIFTVELTSGSYAYQFEFFTNVATALQVAFGANDVLYGHDSGSGVFYTIDLVADTVTPIGQLLPGNFTRFTDLASGPAPQPVE